MTYEEYKSLGGRFNEDQFQEIYPYAVATIEGYITGKVPFWRIKSSLEDYGFDQIDEILMYEIDFLLSSGGINACLGKSDFNFNSVSTSGFSYSIDGGQLEFYKGIPLSPIAVSKLDHALLATGLGCMLI